MSDRRKAAGMSDRVRSGQMTRRGLLGIAALKLSGAAATGVRFTDVAIEAGLGHARNVSGSAENKQWLLEEMGCGVAIIDYDNDGWPDIFLVNGANAAGA